MAPPTVIHVPPKLEDYTPLAEYQVSTPESFYSTKPVLHYSGHRSYVLISPEFIPALPIFDVDPSSGHINGTSTKPREVFGQNVFMVELYVTSANLILWYSAAEKGVVIPYPTISLHAIQRLPSPVPCSDCNSNRTQGLYMQLDGLVEPAEGEEFADPVEMILLPPPKRTTPIEPGQLANPDDAQAQEEAVKALYAAVAACSNMHPDEAQSGDEEEVDDRIVFEGNVGYEGVSGLPGVWTGNGDGGLPPPFPGSGGWITAENVGDYFDENGEWKGSREEQVNKEGKRINGVEDDEGTKRPKRE